MKAHLFIIDPQVDFCDPNGNLFVTGADEDSKRLADMIFRVGDKLYDIHCTLDTHHVIQVFHPSFWVSPLMENPTPFTVITSDDVKNAVWTPVIPGQIQRMIDYVEALEAGGRYPLCIWPEHCLIGSPGHNVTEPVRIALSEWERDNIALVNYVTKGSNLWTEHYSAVQAEVVDPNDETTSLNMNLIQMLQEADIIGIAGQALSHCVANTIRDIANNFGEENIKKFVLLEDLSSNVTSFEQLGDDFVNEMTARGMQVTTSDKFLA